MNYSKLLTSSAIIAGTMGLGLTAFAGPPPVVNAYQYESASSNGSAVDNANTQQSPDYAQGSLSVNQRLSQLQQQVANQKRLNIPAQIQQLQQQVQDLTGKVQVQAHELSQLQKKLQTEQATGITAGMKPAVKSIVRSQINKRQSVPEKAPNLLGHIQNKVLNDTLQQRQQYVQKAMPTSSSNDFLLDQSAYESAYKMIMQKNYLAALTGMQNYLKQYPNGRYVSNAHYWSGEIYLIQNNARGAASEFETVINQYPNSNKISDAMLKLGFIYYDNGQLNKSKRQLDQVVKEYPNTTVAKLAQSRLQDIAQQINASQTSPASSQASANS